ncbi:type I-C CRISPR-associated protein Cas5c [Desulfobotulus sp. H1]|uniref:pre-crRNA processing endonuclease n=1 Tax=Desulfobotulus pelophilus TaxID=2823377 RepID=A0ABT3NCH4_9BACT|nr:type I-C CRISPR-associated protein Cas5c [Desulfobotulus pelophilus]MCW7754652.1 type I-C CRISPR-associated protein Cas5c [Desulfobotulus pelophilus]
MKNGIIKNSISFKVSGRYALFTDPTSRIGGEKCSYHVPTYDALKGVVKSIYSKPTLIWKIKKVRIMNPIRTQTKGMKPISFSGGNSLAIYTFLANVEYQVEAYFVWNEYRTELAPDRINGKHYAIAKRMLEKGGRQDIFLGTRDCQGYVEPCEFGEGKSDYDGLDELGFGLMFHGFDYPDETGENALKTRFWYPVMKHGIIEFPKPEDCTIRKFIRPMEPKQFELGKNLRHVEIEETCL